MLRQQLWLVKNGVPFDVAFSLYEHELTAWGVIFGEFEGEKFDWDLMEWERRD